MTDLPKESTYSSVVSRDSIRISFTLAALNDSDVLSADVQCAYLNAPTKVKVYTIAGLEFGANNVGRPVLIVRALYGLKSSGPGGGTTWLACYAKPVTRVAKRIWMSG